MNSRRLPCGSSADTAAQHQLAQHHAGLDGLAEAHCVGEQQRYARHLECPQYGDELVGLGVDGAIEGCGERRAVAVESRERERRRERRPARRAHHRIELARVHRGRVFDARQGGRLENLSARLDFPQHLVGLGAGAVRVLDLDQVEAAGLVGVEGLDRRNHCPAVADDGHHALARNRCRHFIDSDRSPTAWCAGNLAARRVWE